VREQPAGDAAPAEVGVDRDRQNTSLLATSGVLIRQAKISLSSDDEDLRVKRGQDLNIFGPIGDGPLAETFHLKRTAEVVLLQALTFLERIAGELVKDAKEFLALEGVGAEDRSRAA